MFTFLTKKKVRKHYLYGASRLGSYHVDEALTTSSSSLTNDASKLLFELSNHRGDVVAVVTGVKAANNTPNVVSMSELDPWGFEFDGRTYLSSAGTNYRYGYQGSEKETGLDGMYTTEFRGLEVRLGMWLSPDPIAHPWQSPYASMDNNPVALTDVLGLAAGDKNGPTGEASTAKPGDTWDNMCRCYQTTPEANLPSTGVNPVAGMNFTNFGGDGSDMSKAQMPTQYHTVQRGENFWKLENKLGLKHGTLVYLNPNTDPETIKEGQVINTGTSGEREKLRKMTSKDLYSGYTPPPKTLPGFPDAKRLKPTGGRKRWRLPDGDIIEWDSQHGEVERYNPRGKHVGVWDKDGNQIKDPVPGRKIDPTITPYPTPIGLEIELYPSTDPSGSFRPVVIDAPPPPMVPGSITVPVLDVFPPGMYFAPVLMPIILGAPELLPLIPPAVERAAPALAH
jgi:RHS repeat-associated protein